MRGKKLALSTLFVAMLTIPTVLGAIPLKVVTPVGVVSTEVGEAEARNRNTRNNRLRNVRVTNSGANLAQRFTTTRTSYRVDVRQNTNRANIEIRRNAGQQIRWRIDTRGNTWSSTHPNGAWRNGTYNRWRSQARNNNVRNTIRVNVSEGQERRLRVQVRDRSGNVRTLNFNVQRASGNTWARFIDANEDAMFHRTFDRRIASHNVTVNPSQRFRTFARIDTEHFRAQARSRFRVQNADGTWRAWSSWSAYNRGFANRSFDVIPQGRRAEVQFMIRGVWTNRSHTPLRTRVYTVNFHRPNLRWTDSYWDVLRIWGVQNRTSANQITASEVNIPIGGSSNTFSAGSRLSIFLTSNPSHPNIRDFQVRLVARGQAPTRWMSLWDVTDDPISLSPGRESLRIEIMCDEGEIRSHTLTANFR